MEAPRLIKAFYKMQNAPQPSNADIKYYTNAFDYDGNKRLSFNEYKSMVQALGGHKTYNSNQYQMKKNNSDRHSKKYKYHNHGSKWDSVKFEMKTPFKGFDFKVGIFKFDL